MATINDLPYEILDQVFTYFSAKQPRRSGLLDFCLINRKIGAIATAHLYYDMRIEYDNFQFSESIINSFTKVESHRGIPCIKHLTIWQKPGSRVNPVFEIGFNRESERPIVSILNGIGRSQLLSFRTDLGTLNRNLVTKLQLQPQAQLHSINANICWLGWRDELPTTETHWSPNFGSRSGTTIPQCANGLVNLHIGPRGPSTWSLVTASISPSWLLDFLRHNQEGLRYLCLENDPLAARQENLNLPNEVVRDLPRELSNLRVLDLRRCSKLGFTPCFPQSISTCSYAKVRRLSLFRCDRTVPLLRNHVQHFVSLKELHMANSSSCSPEALDFILCNLPSSLESILYIGHPGDTPPFRGSGHVIRRGILRHKHTLRRLWLQKTSTELGSGLLPNDSKSNDDSATKLLALNDIRQLRNLEELAVSVWPAMIYYLAELPRLKALRLFTPFRFSTVDLDSCITLADILYNWAQELIQPLEKISNEDRIPFNCDFSILAFTLLSTNAYDRDNLEEYTNKFVFGRVSSDIADGEGNIVPQFEMMDDATRRFHFPDIKVMDVEREDAPRAWWESPF
ncbi:hypothetical protein TWF696_004590 [Orbilia brochopaga]|uniref:F-box domain-containing protein n=1 Tax=Orbilia brochopaga TaxID=3140254 RepID=A0AAV9V8G4_9PEZI